MRRPTALIASVLAAGAIVLSGCGVGEDPCKAVNADPDLTSAELVKAAKDNPDVEFETEGRNDAECILDGDTGKWTDQSDEG